MIIYEESKELQTLNEMFIRVEGGLPSKVENSIYYAKLKNLLHREIVGFTKEKIELRDDLTHLRLSVGEQLTEADIREALDALKNKYNLDNNSVGLDYHIEITRIDYGVALFIVIKRDQIYLKKFVFRFRKANISSGIDGLTQAGVFNESTVEKRKQIFNKFGIKGRDE
jgi:hypothetical protein